MFFPEIFELLLLLEEFDLKNELISDFSFIIFTIIQKLEFLSSCGILTSYVRSTNFHFIFFVFTANFEIIILVVEVVVEKEFST